MIENFKLNSSHSSSIVNHYEDNENSSKKELTVRVESTSDFGINSSQNCISEDDFGDAEAEEQNALNESRNVFVSAAISIDYANHPPTEKYIRGNNIVSCWAMRPCDKDETSCIFEWVFCLDLKGSLPKYVLNTVSLML